MLEIRPTTRADCIAFKNEEPVCRIKAHTGLWNGEIIGIGGLAFPPSGGVVAFADLTELARQIQGGLVLHRLARRIMADARAAGIKRLTAQMDAKTPAAERWLKRLGFEPLTPDDKEIWLWRQ